jgi:hypothetical protein
VSGNAGAGHGASVGSWIACLVIIAGFSLGGAAMIVWNWPMFWAGVGVTVLGVIIARAVHIMDDVTEYGGAYRAGADPDVSAPG